MCHTAGLQQISQGQFDAPKSLFVCHLCTILPSAFKANIASTMGQRWSVATSSPVPPPKKICSAFNAWPDSFALHGHYQDNPV
mmetsp:Transcript_32208/g.57781  ORF Transcript_32208/g.57781 Transcript_32208/m.57781 type:complete len:83 (-) Transcript_32208:331-579(-)